MPATLLEGYFDFHYRHRQDLVLVLAELTTLADLGLIDKVLAWRDRLGKLVFGPKPTLAQSTRAVVAFGGLQDCCLQFPDTPYESLRATSVEAALAALGCDESILVQRFWYLAESRGALVLGVLREDVPGARVGVVVDGDDAAVGGARRGLQDLRARCDNGSGGHWAARRSIA